MPSAFASPTFAGADRRTALAEIQAISAHSTILDPRDHADIIGYDTHGPPT